MPTAKRKPGIARERRPGAEYRGKQARTGNSLGFRFDAALFKSHPEFAGEVHAHVIAPGRMLVSVAGSVARRADPVMESFLAFLAIDISKSPESNKPMSHELAKRIDRLVEGIDVSDAESLGDESLI